MRMKLPESVSYIIRKLEENGYEAFAVGGCVRDAILGREPEDWDITTSAKPMEIKAVFRRTVDTGIRHGTVTVMLDHVGYEVTTYRIDGEYEDKRHPKGVSFTTNLKKDLERRDFTINAMAYNERMGLVDEFGGVRDLQNKVIRCVGDAGQRFDEDALRMLRAVRFSGQLGFEIEEQTKRAIVQRAVHLQKISAERIRVEMTKLLVSPGAGQLRTAYETGMTGYFLPELDEMMACRQNNPHHIYTVGEHSIRGVEQINRFFRQEELNGNTALSSFAKGKITQICHGLDKKHHMMLVMAMLLHDIAKPRVLQTDEDGIGHFYGHPEKGREMAQSIMRRLAFDNVTIDVAGRLILWHDYRIECAAKAVRRAASKIGRDIIGMVFLIQYADILSQNPSTIAGKLEKTDRAVELYFEMEKETPALTVGELAVNGGDLIGAGIRPGPRMGEILHCLLELVLEEPERNTRENLMEEVKKISKKLPE